MFERYGTWCSENRLKVTFPLPSFLAQLKKVGIESRPLTLLGKKIRCPRNPELKLEIVPQEESK